MNIVTEQHHFHIETDTDSIVWLHIDKADAGTNVLGSEVLRELDHHLETLGGRAPRGLIILSDKPNGFVAGADINEFTRIRNEEQALQLVRLGQSVFNRLATLAFPTVALIHGFCLGGGLELALACRYRVALADTATRLGLPEVRLGILPGFGGTVRLTALIGGLKAMDLMLSGRSIDARQARRMGLVDRVVPERHLRVAARRLVLDAPPVHSPAMPDRLSNLAPVRPLLSRVLRRQVAAKASPQHYPAPYALIDMWQKYADHPERMLQAEADSIARLAKGVTARNLIRVFLLQERLKAPGRDTEWKPHAVHVIGAGTMGGDIAAWCALRGFRVSLQDQSPERIAPAIKRACELFKRRLKEPRAIQAALDRLLPDHNATGVGRADVIIEAIFEDAGVKRALYQDIEPRMRPDVILATNSSSIPLEELSGALARPDRLVGLHFFNPVPVMQLVEIVNGQSTSAEVSAKAMAFTRMIDRLPLPVSSTPGFLVNRILMPYLMEAVTLESEGVPPAVIDRAATDFGMPMGPLELADTTGLDICLHVAQNLAGHFHTVIPERLQRLVAAGHLGKKSGRGFYRYTKGKAARPSASGGNWNLPEITDRLVLRMLNEAVSCLRERVVENSDLLDAGMIFGTGFAPFRGGPMHHIEGIGVQALRGRLQQLEQLRGKRFAADPGWESLSEAPEPIGLR
jgi:3-hydroxyacyl-CoA dehydrogenase/enoyl-CoA hydratase/3-hydroxybutyryl-CoA epimerase